MEFKVKRSFLNIFIINLVLIFLVCVSIPFAYNTWVFIVVFAICFGLFCFFIIASKTAKSNCHFFCPACLFRQNLPVLSTAHEWIAILLQNIKILRGRGPSCRAAAQDDSKAGCLKVTFSLSNKEQNTKRCHPERRRSGARRLAKDLS